MIDLKQALKLSPDCFTPLARTPWAGIEIHKRYKNKVRPSKEPLAIGESWEVSCDPDFPSQISSNQQPLLSLVQEHPAEMLSPAYVARKGANCEILIKLLNAASPLSVQVHPRDGDSQLLPHECGKPESWLILDAEPGAGLYLGFSRILSREELRKLLQKDADLRPYLQFVSVKPGDYFEIQPGVPHAIGPGITLLEPQRVLLGKSGKTYRFWDWGRRYNASGALDLTEGKPRELHIEEGLRLIDPETQVGEGFVAKLRRQPEVFALPAAGSIERYPANASYQVLRVRIPAALTIDWTIQEGFATLVSLGGDFTWTNSQQKAVRFAKGEPGFLPYSAFPLRLRAEESSDLALVIPAQSQLAWNLARLD